MAEERFPARSTLRPWSTSLTKSDTLILSMAAISLMAHQNGSSRLTLVLCPLTTTDRLEFCALMIGSLSSPEHVHDTRHMGKFTGEKSRSGRVPVAEA